jgi:transposase
LTDIHHQGRRPGKDVHLGDHGKEEALPSSFSKQFKAEVVDLVRQPGNTPASVARDLDLTESAVRGWVRQAEIDGGGREGLTSAEREELSRLRKENRVLREERDILKRATAYVGDRCQGERSIMPSPRRRAG